MCVVHSTMGQVQGALQCQHVQSENVVTHFFGCRESTHDAVLPSGDMTSLSLAEDDIGFAASLMHKEAQEASADTKSEEGVDDCLPAEALPAVGPKGQPVRSAAPSASQPVDGTQKMAKHIALEICNEVQSELRTSQMESLAACSGSTALAYLWGRFFYACDDPVFRIHSYQVCPKPGGPSISFFVELRRTSMDQRFGFECTEAPGAEGVLLVTGMERGCCVDMWNDSCSELQTPWRRVHLCAAILSVNRVAGCCHTMRRAMTCHLSVELLVCNPPTLHDAVGVLRNVRAAGPRPAGEPFWAGAQQLALVTHESSKCLIDTATLQTRVNNARPLNGPGDSGEPMETDMDEIEV